MPRLAVLGGNGSGWVIRGSPQPDNPLGKGIMLSLNHFEKFVWEKTSGDLRLPTAAVSTALCKAALSTQRGWERIFFNRRIRRLVQFLNTPVNMKFIRRLFRPCHKGQQFVPEFYYPGSLWPNHNTQRLSFVYSQRTHPEHVHIRMPPVSANRPMPGKGAKRTERTYGD